MNEPTNQRTDEPTGLVSCEEDNSLDLTRCFVLILVSALFRGLHEHRSECPCLEIIVHCAFTARTWLPHLKHKLRMWLAGSLTLYPLILSNSFLYMFAFDF